PLMKMIFGMTIASILILNLMPPAKVLADNNMTKWNVQHVIGKFLNSNPAKPDQIFNFQYRVLNGTLETLTKDSYGQFIAKVKSIDHGMFELKIPRNYPLSNMPNGTANSLSISVNGIDIYPQKYSFVATDCFFEYSIPFSGSTSVLLAPISYPESIPFQGASVPDHCISETTVIPEFPVVTFVLLVSFVSLIVFYRTKFKLTSF
ncbi:MAG: hypothetical protein ACREAD_05530, partial [Nitrosopumilaceae archaeon]